MSDKETGNVKKSNYQSLVVAMLLVALTAFGFVLLKSFDSTDETIQKTSLAVDSRDNTQQPINNDSQGTIASSWAIYDTGQDMTIRYPSTWTQEANTELCCGQSLNIYLKSEDYTSEVSAFSDELTTSGAKVSIIVSEASAAKLKDIDRSSGPLGEWWQTSPQTITELDGFEAWQYESAYEGDSPFFTQVIANNRLYEINFDGAGFEDETTSELFTTYQAILKTISFK